MERRINISYPASLAYTLKLNAEDFENEIKMHSVVKLFELGKISSATAANVLGIPRIDFLDILPKYKVSIFNYTNYDEIDEDLLNA